MNSKERLLRAIRFEEVDRIPVVPRLNVLNFLRELYKKPPTWKDHLRCSKEFGFDPVFYVGPVFSNRDFSIMDLFKENKYINKKDDKGGYFLITYEYKTPIRTLTTKIREYKDPQVGSQFSPVEKTEEFLLKNEEDIPVLKYLIRDFKEDDFDRFCSITKTVNVQGLVMGCIPHPLASIIELHGLTETMIDIRQNVSFIKRLLNIFQKKALTCIELFSRAGAEVIYTDGVWTTTDLLSPIDFEHLIAPLLEEQVHVAKKRGMLFHYFMDGNFMDNLGTLKSTGIDILSPLCPPPVGDANFEVLRQETREKICLWGGINATALLSADELEVKKLVKKLLESIADTTGFVLSTTASIQPGTSVKIFRSFIEAGKKYGR